jgi:hypothetical protein
MKIEEMIEHEDGSATLNIDATKEEIAMLVEAGLIALLKKHIEQMEKECPVGSAYLKEKDNAV